MMEFSLAPSGKYLLIQTLGKEKLFQIQKEEKKEAAPAILLPEDSKLSKTTIFSVAKLLAAGNLCTNFRVTTPPAREEERLILVRSNMVEKVTVGEQTFEVILEQHAVGELESS